LAHFKALQTNSGLAEFLGNYEVAYGDYKRYQQDLRDLMSVTTEEIKSECQALIDRHPRPAFFSIWDQYEKTSVE
jgi:predicted Zn-dependent peptidase